MVKSVRSIHKYLIPHRGFEFSSSRFSNSFLKINSRKISRTRTKAISLSCHLGSENICVLSIAVSRLIQSLLGYLVASQELSETRKRSLWSGTIKPSFMSLSLRPVMMKDCLGSTTTVPSLSWTPALHPRRRTGYRSPGGTS